MTFDQAWAEYCERWSHDFSQHAGLAEEMYNAGKEDREVPEVLNAEQLKTELSKIRGIRFFEVHAATVKGKMLDVVLHNDEKPVGGSSRRKSKV